MNVQAARQFGMGNLMNEANGNYWLEIARASGANLVGSGATIESWVEYAWRLSTPAANTPAPAPAPTATPAPTTPTSPPVSPANPPLTLAPLPPPTPRTNPGANTTVPFNSVFETLPGGNKRAIYENFDQWAVERGLSRPGQGITVTPVEAQRLYDQYKAFRESQEPLW